jgi:hypothetical protein
MGALDVSTFEHVAQLIMQMRVGIRAGIQRLVFDHTQPGDQCVVLFRVRCFPFVSGHASTLAQRGCARRSFRRTTAQAR